MKHYISDVNIVNVHGWPCNFLFYIIFRWLYTPVLFTNDLSTLLDLAFRKKSRSLILV